MKAKAAMLAAALTLGGCDYVRISTGGGNETEEAAANSAIANPPPQDGARPEDAGVTTSRSLQPRPPAPPATGGKDPNGAAPMGPIDPAMLIGSWGDNGDCRQPSEFFGDGTFRAANGVQGRWRLTGDRVTVSNGARSVTFQIVSLGPDEVIVRDRTGQTGRSTRC